eukprot:UN07326
MMRDDRLFTLPVVQTAILKLYDFYYNECQQQEGYGKQRAFKQIFGDKPNSFFEDLKQILTRDILITIIVRSNELFPTADCDVLTLFAKLIWDGIIPFDTVEYLLKAGFGYRKGSNDIIYTTSVE